MNFISGIPVLFGWVMYTGGPESAFANWTMVGGLSFCVSLVLAEIAAAFPTAGGIYFWASIHVTIIIYILLTSL
jgi:amino acid transporter